MNRLALFILMAILLLPMAPRRVDAGFGFGLSASIESFGPDLIERGKRTPMTVSVKNTGITATMYVRIKTQPEGWTVESVIPSSNTISNNQTRVFQFFVTAPTSGSFPITVEVFADDLPLQVRLAERTATVDVQTLPEPFNIFTPIQNEEVPNDVNLSWSFSVGAESYDAEIFELSSGGQPVSPARIRLTNLTNTSIIIPNSSFIKGNAYNAVVTAKNRIGTRVNADGPRRFSIRPAPQLGAFSITYPIPNLALAPNPRFEWTASQNARNYTLFILPDEGGNPGSTPIREVPGLTQTSHTYANPPLPAGRGYFVSVRAFGEPDAASRLNQQGPVPFYIPALSSFQLLSPTPDSSRIGLLPEFRWQFVQGTTYYIIAIERFTTFGWRRWHQDRVDQLEGVIAYQMPARKPLIWNDLYRWDVTAIRETNGVITEVVGSVDGFREFRTTQMAPFDLLSPASGAKGVSVKPAFAWESTPGVTVYAVEVTTPGPDGKPQMAGRLVSPALLETAFASTFPDLARGGKYFWRVRATDGLATIYNYGDWQPFTVTSLGTFGIASPVNLSTGVSPKPTLTWTASAGAKQYKVRMAIKGGLILPDIVVNAPQTSVDFTQIGRSLNSQTTYQWTVVAVDGTVELGAPQIFEFTTGIRDDVGSRDVLEHLLARQQFGTVDRASAGFFGNARIDAAGYMQVRLVE